MKTLATFASALAIALGLGGSALADAAHTGVATHHHKHHLRHHRPAATHPRIGPGGDQDGDNHGAPTDGDGNL